MDYPNSVRLFNSIQHGVQVKHFPTGADYVQFLGMKRKLSSFIKELDESLNILVSEYNAEWTLRNDQITKAREKAAFTEDRLLVLSPEDEAFLKTKPPVQITEANELLCYDKSFFDKVSSIRAKNLEIELNFIKDAELFKKLFQECPLAAQDTLYEFLFKAH